MDLEIVAPASTMSSQSTRGFSLILSDQSVLTSSAAGTNLDGLTEAMATVKGTLLPRYYAAELPGVACTSSFMKEASLIIDQRRAAAPSNLPEKCVIGYLWATHLV